MIGTADMETGTTLRKCCQWYLDNKNCMLNGKIQHQTSQLPSLRKKVVVKKLSLLCNEAQSGSRDTALLGDRQGRVVNATV